MITLAIAGVILTTFSIMFYLEDRDGGGGGLYDPDPSASYRHKQSR